MIRCASFACLAAFLLAATAEAAPTTRPADAAWSKTVASLAHALSVRDAAGLDALLPAGAVVKSFDGSPADVARLIARVTRGTLVSARAYTSPPAVLAADLAADAKKSSAVPAEWARRMDARDDRDMARANATAAQWLATSVGSTDGDPVAVICLWVPTQDPAGAADAPAGDMVFALVKGVRGEAGQVFVRTIAFGDPLR